MNDGPLSCYYVNKKCIFKMECQQYVYYICRKTNTEYSVAIDLYVHISYNDVSKAHSNNNNNNNNNTQEAAIAPLPLTIHPQL